MTKATAARSQAAFDRALGEALKRVFELCAEDKIDRAGTLYREISHVVRFCDPIVDPRELSL